ncbi:MAG: hypothetical protein IT190_05640 [Microbacteriaceae bacterium]|nr:hypothetical protein [Microbacteriaceae bacterium]
MLSCRTSRRWASVAAVAALPAVLLTACNPEVPAVPPSVSTDSPNSSQSATPSVQAQQLPPDGLLGVVGTVTADTGATLVLTLIVHSSKAATDATTAPLVSAIVDECSGELDTGVLNSNGYGLVQIDYTATLTSSKPWPTDLPVLLLPTAEGDAELASDGNVAQIAVLPAPFQQGDYVPHCQQSAFLTGVGTGTTYFALPRDASDTPPFERWADFAYGFTANSPAGFTTDGPFGGINPDRVTFADCIATISPLAATLGYPSPSWSQEFAIDHCAVGGNTQAMGG